MLCNASKKVQVNNILGIISFAKTYAKIGIGLIYLSKIFSLIGFLFAIFIKQKLLSMIFVGLALFCIILSCIIALKKGIKFIYNKSNQYLSCEELTKKYIV